MIKNSRFVLKMNFCLKSLETDNFFFNTKYVVQQMLHEQLQSERGIAVLASLAGDEI